MTKRNRKLFLGVSLSLFSFGGTMLSYSIGFGSVQKFDTELSLDAGDYAGEKGVDYLFSTGGKHWLGMGAYGDDTAGADAGAAIIRALNLSGEFLTGSVNQFDTELGLIAGQGLGRGGISYLFSSGGKHRLGGGAQYSSNNAGAAIIWAVDDDGLYVAGSARQFDTEFSVEAFDYFASFGISYLFSSGGNHRIGSTAYGEDTAGSSAGAAIIRAIDDNADMVPGSIRQFDDEFPIDSSDEFGNGGISYLYSVGEQYRLGAGAYYDETAGSSAGAAIIWAVDASGQLISGSVKMFDTELGLTGGELFGEGGVSHVFSSGGQHWLAGGAPKDSTVSTRAGAAILWAVNNSGSLITGSVKQFDAELGVAYNDRFGKGGVNHLFSAEGQHWLGGGAYRKDGAGSEAGAAIIWAINDVGDFVSGTLRQYETELGLNGGDNFGMGDIRYLFDDLSGNPWLGGGAYQSETAGPSAGAGIIWSVTGVPVCGDGVLTSSEICDDGNKINEDGCSSVCAVEENYVCVGEPSVCTMSSAGGCEGGEFTGTGESKVCVQLGDLVLNPICNLDFGSFNQQPITQTNTGSMDCEISVRDHKGISPWYVTLDFGDMGPEGAIAGTPDIASANLSMLQSSGAALGLSGSMENPHVTTIDHLYNTSHFDGPTVQNVLQRTITGDQIGIYGTQPSFQLIIPAYTVAATYKGTITATLIEE